MDEVLALIKQIITVVGCVEMAKHFDKNNKVPGFVWVVITAIFGFLSIAPVTPEWVLDGALVTSISTLFYDTILKNMKKGIEKKLGGSDE